MLSYGLLAIVIGLAILLVYALSLLKSIQQESNLIREQSTLQKDAMGRLESKEIDPNAITAGIAVGGAAGIAGGLYLGEGVIYAKALKPLLVNFPITQQCLRISLDVFITSCGGVAGVLGGGMAATTAVETAETVGDLASRLYHRPREPQEPKTLGGDTLTYHQEINCDEKEENIIL